MRNSVDKESAGKTGVFIRWLVVITVLIIICLIYFFLDPAGYGWMPKCPLYLFTGLKCPGCGSQRMIHALLHGDITAAFNANALILILLPGIIGIAVIEAGHKRWPGCYNAVHSPFLLWSVVVVIIGWFILRNIPGCHF